MKEEREERELEVRAAKSGMHLAAGVMLQSRLIEIAVLDDLSETAAWAALITGENIYEVGVCHTGLSPLTRKPRLSECR